MGGRYISDQTAGNDYIQTSDYDSRVWAFQADSDTIIGGSGDDAFYIGNDAGTNTQITGGGGNDTISALQALGVVYATPGTGTGINVVIGGNYSNHIYGNLSRGTLYERGGIGQDELIGGMGNNHFIMTPGGDFVTGGGSSNGYLFNDLNAGDTHLNNFNTATDVIGIYTGGFGGDLYAGETLTLGYNLINGTQSAANTSTFLYSGGALYYDADGTGPVSSPVEVAGFVTAPSALLPSNFAISGTAF